MIDLPYEVYVWIKSVHVVFASLWGVGLILWTEIFALSMKTGSGEFIRFSCSLMNKMVTPAAVLSVVSGTLLVFNMGEDPEPWLHVKILLAAMLCAYHARLFVWSKKFISGKIIPPQSVLRWLNIFPFLLFVCIVFLVVVRPF